MRLFKLIVTLIVLGLIALFIGQNLGTWTSPIPFKFELPLLGTSVWTFQLYLVMLFSMLLGLMVATVLIMRPYLNLRRTLARERQERKEAPMEITENQAQAS
ncbi:MAG: hypothetical protein AAGU11_13700 [Syntrophobacteraceae bacterium]